MTASVLKKRVLIRIPPLWAVTHRSETITEIHVLTRIFKQINHLPLLHGYHDDKLELSHQPEACSDRVAFDVQPQLIQHHSHHLLHH